MKHIQITTPKDSSLLVAIKKSIDSGQVVGWSYDKEGDFTHNVEQWKDKLFLHPSAESQGIDFSLVPPANTHINKTMMGVYLGKFVEMLITDFNDKIESINIVE